MGHNVIIGKSYGGHFEFMQIRPPMKCFFCLPPKNIANGGGGQQAHQISTFTLFPL